LEGFWVHPMVCENWAQWFAKKWLASCLCKSLTSLCYACSSWAAPIMFLICPYSTLLEWLLRLILVASVPGPLLWSINLVVFVTPSFSGISICFLVDLLLQLEPQSVGLTTFVFVPCLLVSYIGVLVHCTFFQSWAGLVWGSLLNVGSHFLPLIILVSLFPLCTPSCILQLLSSTEPPESRL